MPPKLTLLQTTPSWIIAVIIFILIFIFYLAGHTFRLKKIAKDPDHVNYELGTMSGTLLGLLGFLLAFTFGMSNSRYDNRRNSIVEEANDIGTAILRSDLYPDSLRKVLRENFKEYVEARIAHYEAGMNMESTVYYYLKADSIGKVLFSIAAKDARVNNIVVRSAPMIVALNSMIDITTTRRSVGEASIPSSILYFLFALCMCSSFFMGYNNKYKTDWVVLSGLAIFLSITVYMILDLDHPRSGLINMNLQNEKIIELRELFH